MIAYLRNDRKQYPPFQDEEDEQLFLHEIDFWGVKIDDEEQKDKHLKAKFPQELINYLKTVPTEASLDARKTWCEQGPLNFYKINKLGAKLYPDLQFGRSSTHPTYKGQLNKEGKSYGICRSIVANSSMYEGQVYNYQMHGYGRLIYANGDFYEGMFVRNKRQGFGKLNKIRQGQLIEHDGKWENDIFLK